MAKIVYYVAASLDGFIADSTGGVDWLPDGESGDYGYAEFYAGVEALIMGRRTYDQALSFGEWPYSGKPAYVFTKSPPCDGLPEVRFVEGSPVDFYRGITELHAGTVWLVGGADLADQFRQSGLIDEYQIFVIPVILGCGIPLTSPRHSGESRNPLPTRLKLVESQSYDDGVVMLRYLPRIPLDSGSRPE